MKSARYVYTADTLCGICGAKLGPNTKVWTHDHIIPLGRGGSPYAENIQPAHYSCNNAKGDSLNGVPKGAGQRAKPKPKTPIEVRPLVSPSISRNGKGMRQSLAGCLAAEEWEQLKQELAT